MIHHLRDEDGEKQRLRVNKVSNKSGCDLIAWVGEGERARERRGAARNATQCFPQQSRPMAAQPKTN